MDANPTLTIISAAAFDAVKVFNRADGAGTDRINGATITAIVSGVSSSAQFPIAAAAQYLFSLSSGSLLLSPCKYLQPGLIRYLPEINNKCCVCMCVCVSTL